MDNITLRNIEKNKEKFPVGTEILIMTSWDGKNKLKAVVTRQSKIRIYAKQVYNNGELGEYEYSFNANTLKEISSNGFSGIRRLCLYHPDLMLEDKIKELKNEYKSLAYELSNVSFYSKVNMENLDKNLAKLKELAVTIEDYRERFNKAREITR